MDFLLRLGLAALTVLSVILTMLGLAGNTVLLFIALGYAWYMDFTAFSWQRLGVVAGIYLLGELWDFVIGYLGIKKEKVSWRTVLAIGIGTTAGALLGAVALPVIGSFPGAVAGAFISAFLMEYFFGPDRTRAARVAWVAARNHLLALLGKVAVGVTIAFAIIQSLFFTGN